LLTMAKASDIIVINRRPPQYQGSTQACNQHINSNTCSSRRNIESFEAYVDDSDRISTDPKHAVHLYEDTHEQIVRSSIDDSTPKEISCNRVVLSSNDSDRKRTLCCSDFEYRTDEEKDRVGKKHQTDNGQTAHGTTTARPLVGFPMCQIDLHGVPTAEVSHAQDFSRRDGGSLITSDEKQEVKETIDSMINLICQGQLTTTDKEGIEPRESEKYYTSISEEKSVCTTTHMDFETTEKESTNLLESDGDESISNKKSVWVTDRELDDNSEESYTSSDDESVDSVWKKDLTISNESGMELEHFAQGLAMNMFKNVVILSGAGVSVSAGIPDFRTPGTGLYDNLQKYNLPEPEDVFDLDFYRCNPYPFVSLCQELWPGQNKHNPTLAHCFIRLLAEKGILLRNFTQNIDGLEVISGISSDKVYECHGHFRTASCIECKSEYDGDNCREQMLQGIVPSCASCGGRVKPDIVFFGESLSPRFAQLVRKDLPEVDLLIVMGTSLKIPPVCLIPELVRCPRLLINRECVGSFVESSSEGGRASDFFLQGDCDDGVRKLCKMAGWESELDRLKNQVNMKFTQTSCT